MLNITKYKIPTEFIVSADMETLESYISNFDSQLRFIAMESSSPSDDQFAAMSAKARAAGKKIIDGKKKGNSSMILQGNAELTDVTKQLVNENKNASSFDIKAKLMTVAKVIVAVIGTVLLAFGLYKTGRIIKKFVNGRASKQEVLKTVNTPVNISSPATSTSKLNPTPKVQSQETPQAQIEITPEIIDNLKSALLLPADYATDRVYGLSPDHKLCCPVDLSNGHDKKTIKTMGELNDMIQNHYYQENWKRVYPTDDDTDVMSLIKETMIRKSK